MKGRGNMENTDMFEGILEMLGLLGVWQVIAEAIEANADDDAFEDDVSRVIAETQIATGNPFGCFGGTAGCTVDSDVAKGATLDAAIIKENQRRMADDDVCSCGDPDCGYLDYVGGDEVADLNTWPTWPQRRMADDDVCSCGDPDCGYLDLNTWPPNTWPRTVSFTMDTVDPELERLLDEEEEIERQYRNVDSGGWDEGDYEIGDLAYGDRPVNMTFLPKDDNLNRWFEAVTPKIEDELVESCGYPICLAMQDGSFLSTYGEPMAPPISEDIEMSDEQVEALMTSLGFKKLDRGGKREAALALLIEDADILLESITVFKESIAEAMAAGVNDVVIRTIINTAFPEDILGRAAEMEQEANPMVTVNNNFVGGPFGREVPNLNIEDALSLMGCTGPGCKVCGGW